MNPCGRGLGTPAQVGLALVRAYKILISPLFAGSCRYVPGCADYTAEAIARFGLMKGSWLGARRLARCHPFGGHGLDPVPDRNQK
jgi:putative membrane protein insertion efficiency factor